ncbi:hypothetical protein DERP_002803 [Dermatophagoides pteronyssinus]|uniref:Uncharacterized protein n=1 Tax=Dermatophagoides pteronyssinus TaxID=6956 RepID=A0ABQ8JVR2_DERPT|nr:hypothetical protein DERP_002803 [Dermatophagoides pteronyssinus]
MSQTHSQDTFIYIIYDDVWDVFDDDDGIKISLFHISTAAAAAGDHQHYSLQSECIISIRES